jgi:hypothetical protein
MTYSFLPEVKRKTQKLSMTRKTLVIVWFMETLTIKMKETRTLLRKLLLQRITRRMSKMMMTTLRDAKMTREIS